MRAGPRIGPNVGLAVGPRVGVVSPTWTLEKTGGVSGSYDAEAYTVESFAGTVELFFTIDAAVDAYAIGLSADNPDANYNTIDRALHNDTGTMYKNEDAALTAIGACAPGEEWSIRRTMPGGAVSYRKNGVEVATGAAAVGALIVDSSFRFTGDRVTGVRVEVNGVGQDLTWGGTGVTATEE